MCEIARNKTFLLFLLSVFILIPGILTAQQADTSTTWLKPLVNLERYYVVIDNDFKNPHLIQRGDSIRVEPGKRKVTIVWQTISDNNSTLNIEPGITKTHRVYFSSFSRSPRSSFNTIVNQENLRITTDRGASIYVDGEYIGKHTVATIVKPGDKKITTEHPEYGKLTKTISVSTYKVTDFARYNENPSNLSFAAKLVPGAEYIASKRYVGAAISLVGLSVLTGNLIRTNNLYNDKYDEFKYWEIRYLSSDNTSEVIQFRENALEAEDDLQNISQQFNISLAALGAAYLISTFDSFRKPRTGYKGPSFFKNSQISVVSKSFNNQTFPLLSYQYTFD